MKTFLLFLSSLLLFVTFGAQGAETGDSGQERLRRYAFLMETQKAGVSGIMIAAESADAITASIVNEFGISAIDFTYNKQNRKLKLLRVVSFLDKWYIKRQLRNDLKCCIQVLYSLPDAKAKDYDLTLSADSLTITNVKRHIKYTFSPLPAEEPAEEEENIIEEPERIEFFIVKPLVDEVKVIAIEPETE